jgi:tight adherence protein B
MSELAWALAALLLTLAAAVAAWPAGTALRRLHGRRRIPVPTITAADLRRLVAFVDGSPRRTLSAAVLTGAAVGLLVAGPVAGLVLAVYAALGARAAVRRAARRRVVAARSRSLDNLNALAADLRAGLAAAGPRELTEPDERPDPGRAFTGPDERPDPGRASTEPDERPDPRLAELTSAVWRLAEQTGAPAADLVERIETDARAGDRSRATAGAQAAGAQATALLLAALPIGGIALGYGVGVDPLEVLLHTPMGAACATAALLLQCGGLLWADRLTSGPAQ